MRKLILREVNILCKVTQIKWQSQDMRPGVFSNKLDAFISVVGKEERIRMTPE